MFTCFRRSLYELACLYPRLAPAQKSGSLYISSVSRANTFLPSFFILLCTYSSWRLQFCCSVVQLLSATMYSLSIVAALATLFSSTLAISAPQMPGFNPTWVEDFSGTSINTANWQHWTPAPTNGEQEIYTADIDNCNVTASNTLQILPQNSGGQWTSCRIETLGVWSANATNPKMLVQASIKVGVPGVTASQLMGIWPAFWSLGVGVRNGVPWPACGEIDTFENVRGVPTGYGTLHCGNACHDNQGNVGISNSTSFTYGTFHTWAHEVDLTSADWTAQAITFFVDGTQYQQIRGSDVRDLTAWTTLTGDMMLTLNVAVGGDWGGAAGASTATGITAGMEVEYVAVYHSN